MERRKGYSKWRGQKSQIPPRAKRVSKESSSVTMKEGDFQQKEKKEERTDNLSPQGFKAYNFWEGVLRVLWNPEWEEKKSPTPADKGLPFLISLRSRRQSS